MRREPLDSQAGVEKLKALPNASVWHVPQPEPVFFYDYSFDHVRHA